MKPFPSSVRLCQYRTIEDLWQETLKPWLIRASQEIFDGTEAYLVLDQLSQSQWIHQRADQENIPLLGIRFLNVDLLRTELSQKLHLSRSFLKSEVIHFLLRLETSEKEDDLSQSITLNPSIYLEAMENLIRSGYKKGIPQKWPEYLARPFEGLAFGHLWEAFLDRELLQKATTSTAKLNLAVVGWDAEFFPHLRLLQAACLFSQQSEIGVPMPRVTEDDPDVIWIKTLEETFRTVCEISQSSNFETGNATLAENLFLNQRQPELKLLPSLFLANDSSHQTQIILSQLESIFQENQTQPVGIVFPSCTASQIELACELDKRNIAYSNEITRQADLNISTQLQLACLDYFQNQCHVEKLMTILDTFNDFPKISKINSVQARKRLFYFFTTLPTHNAFFLAKKLDPHVNESEAQLHDWIIHLAPWPKSITWAEAKLRWNKLLDFLELEASWEYYLPDNFAISSEEIVTDYFFDFLKQILTSERFFLTQESRMSPLIITTLAQANHRVWSHLIFAECNESSWPLAVEENPFFKDEAKKEWNSLRTFSQTYLLTTTSQLALQRRRFLDLIEHCEKSITLIAYQTNPSQPLNHQFTNEWFRQCSYLYPEALITPPSFSDSLPLKKEASLLSSFKKIHRSRQSPHIPFDEYFLNLEKLKIEQPWDASQLEEALLFPATFAFRLIWQAESLTKFQFSPHSPKIIGAWTHHWLQYILQKLPHSPRDWTSEESFHHLNQIYHNFIRQISHFLEVKELPLWWITLIEKTHWATRKCLESLLTLTPYYNHFLLAKSSTLISENQFHLKKSCDLLLKRQENDQTTVLHFIHFKIGKFKKINLARLEENQGFRYATHFFEAQHSDSLQVSGISPWQGVVPLFSKEDWEKIQLSFGKISYFQRKRIFGWYNPLYHSQQKTEVLPLATRPLSEAILKDKYTLSFSELALEPNSAKE